jgi:ABC-type enterobactin transport system permease subunit
MILALIIINENIKIVTIIGKVIGGSCIGMLVILIGWKLSSNHGLWLLILIGDIKMMITFVGNMTLFKTYLTENISGLRDISVGELNTSSSTTIRNTATSVHNRR